MGAARFAVACVAAGLLAACGLAVNGLETAGSDAGGPDATGDVKTGDGSQGGSSGGDTGAPGDAKGGDTSSSDTGTAGDVVTDVAPVDGCVPKGPENCTNGVDDDCNGLVDCADPACTAQGYACVPVSPSGGWDIEAFDATSQAGCPPSLKAKNVDVDPMNLSAPASCDCICAVGAPPSCEQGSISATHGPTDQCGSAAMTYPASGGNCNKQDLSVDAFVQATQPPPAGGTCNPTTTPTVPPTGATQGETCSGQTAFGGGCPAQQTCALVPTGFTACIHHGGANMACPAGGYTTPHSVGTVTDNRGCNNACACGAPTATCSVGSWAFFTSNDCSGTASVSLVTDDHCDPTGPAVGGATYPTNQFTSTPQAGTVACGLPTTQPGATGNATLMGADTLCCE